MVGTLEQEAQDRAARMARALELAEEAFDLDGEDRERFLADIRAEDELLGRALQECLDGNDDSWLRSVVGRGVDDALAVTAQRQNPFQPGEQIDAYLLGEPLGQGGMGWVFRARQDQPRRDVAFKLLAPRHGAATADALLQEPEILGRLRHPHIAQVYAAGVVQREQDGQQQDWSWFSMELVEGGRPIDRHCLEAKLSLRERIELFLTVCSAVAHGHNEGVLHRDIKPDNVLVDGEGRVKVIDFGIALAAESGEDLKRLGLTGQLAGTLAYMSPEQAVPGALLGFPADVYSLGVLLHRLLTGRLPVEVVGHTVIKTLLRLRLGPPPDARESGCPPALAAVLAKALSRDPLQRYASAAALAEDLRRFLAHRPVSAARYSSAQRLGLAVRRHRWLTGFVALLLVVAVLSVLFGLEQRRLALDNSALAEANGALADELAVALDDSRGQAARALEASARAASARGDWPQMIGALEQRLELDVPAAWTVRLGLAGAYRLMDDVEAAREQLAILQLLTPETERHGRLLLLEGLLELEDGHPEDGWALMDQALARGLEGAEAALAEGLTARDAQGSIEALRRAVVQDPALSVAWQALMETLLYRGLYAEVADVARTMQVRQPRYLDGHRLALLFAPLSGREGDMAWVRLAAGTWLAAEELEAWERSGDLLVEALNAVVRASAARSLRSLPDLGRFVAAFQELTGVLDRSDTWQQQPLARFAHQEQGRLVSVMNQFLLQQDIATARATLDEGVAINPSPLSRFLRGLFLRNEGRQARRTAADFRAVQHEASELEDLARLAQVLAIEAELASAVWDEDTVTLLRVAREIDGLESDLLGVKVVWAASYGAMVGGDHALATRLLVRSRQMEPLFDQVAQVHEMLVDLEAGHSFSALLRANRLLARSDLQADVRPIAEQMQSLLIGYLHAVGEHTLEPPVHESVRERARQTTWDLLHSLVPEPEAP